MAVESSARPWTGLTPAIQLNLMKEASLSLVSCNLYFSSDRGPFLFKCDYGTGWRRNDSNAIIAVNRNQSAKNG